MERKDKVTYRVEFRLGFEKDGLGMFAVWSELRVVEFGFRFGLGLGRVVRFRTRRWWQ